MALRFPFPVTVGDDALLPAAVATTINILIVLVLNLAHAMRTHISLFVAPHFVIYVVDAFLIPVPVAEAVPFPASVPFAVALSCRCRRRRPCTIFPYP